MSPCPMCFTDADVVSGRCWECGAVRGHPVEARCACGWRLDGARVCPACGTTNEQEAAA